MPQHHARCIALAFAFTFAACAHTPYHPDVRAGESGVNVVRLQTDDTDRAGRNALSQANDYCLERKKDMVVVNEEAKYTGTLVSEATYNAMKAGGKGASTLGFSKMGSSSTKQRTQGRDMSTGSAVSDATLGKGYTYTLQFKCQST